MIKRLLENFSFIQHLQRSGKDNPTQSGAIAACASITPKHLNRDAFVIIDNNNLGLKGVAVADGIGSTDRVEEISRFSVESVKAQVEDLCYFDNVNMTSIFTECMQQAHNTFTGNILSDQFGTTLIVAMECSVNEKKCILAGYVGNGALWHIKGNFNHFDENQYFPWNAINYLNPHSIQINGREVLINCISLAPIENFSGASTVHISCDQQFGDIIMACTDGIYSYDQVSFIKDGLGEIWHDHGQPMIFFLDCLDRFFKEGVYTNDSLGNMLNNYLAELKKEDLLDDDATIGLIISEKAMNYQRNLLYEQDHKSQQKLSDR